MTSTEQTVERIGRYEIIRKIATGGMAELFLGKFTGPGGFEKRCAIKRILPQFAADQTFQRMFQTEARVTAMFDHPNVVQVFELGQDEKAQFFIAMELVNGMNLRQLIHMAREQGIPIPPELAAFMMAQALDGLAYAHTFCNPDTNEPLNLVHRDISPQNILVSFDGAVKLVDFGIVKGSSISGETQAGMLKGKVAYMSPEQASGEPLDGRSDLFSIGVCFYELISGQRPYQGTNDIMTLKAILDDPPPPLTHFLPDLAEGIEHSIYRALEKFPDGRYDSARTFQMELQQVLRDCPTPLGRHVVADFIRSLTEGNTVTFDASRLRIPRGLQSRPPAGFAMGNGASAASVDGSHPGLAAQPLGHTSHPGYAPQRLESNSQPSLRTEPRDGGAQQAWVDSDPSLGHSPSQPGGPYTPAPAMRAPAYTTPPPSDGDGRTPLPLDESIGGTSEVLRQAGLSHPKRRSGLWLIFALSAAVGAATVAFAVQQRNEVVMVEPATPSGRLVDVIDPPVKPLPTKAIDERIPGPNVPKPAEAAVEPGPTVRPAPPPRRRSRSGRRGRSRTSPKPAPAPTPVKTGRVSLSSIPSGLTVRNGSKVLGKTPLEADLPPGRYTLSVGSAAHGIRRTVRVTVTEGGITTDRVQVGRGTLKVVSRPWAEVYVNGLHKGKTPLTLPAFEGKQTVKLVSEDGQERIQTAEIEADKETRVAVKF